MGQNVGAGKYNRVNKILFAAETCVIVIGFGLSMLVRLFATPLQTTFPIAIPSSSTVIRDLVRPTFSMR